jgi:hypothetical protein
MIKTIDAKETDKNLLEADFYSKPFYFSYSSLNRLLLAPNIFYKEYVLKQKEPYNAKHLLEGTLIHFLILEHNNFDEKFITLPDSLPSDNTIKVLNTVYNKYLERVAEDSTNSNLTLDDFEDEVDEILKTINLHQNVKDQTKRLAKIIDEQGRSYFDFLKVKNKKELIDSETLDKCTRAADIIKNNKVVRDLLGLDLTPDGKTIGIYNELELQMKLEGFQFGIKGIIDNLVINVNTKTIRINDFKTSNKGIQNFKDTVDYWNYWLQAIIYVKLVTSFCKEFLDESWCIEFRFIVFDNCDHIYPFLVKDTTITEWERRYDDVINAALYHYENKEFNLPYEFATGNVNL